MPLRIQNNHSKDLRESDRAYLHTAVHTSHTPHHTCHRKTCQGVAADGTEQQLTSEPQSAANETSVAYILTDNSQNCTSSSESDYIFGTRSPDLLFEFNSSISLSFGDIRVQVCE